MYISMTIPQEINSFNPSKYGHSREKPPGGQFVVFVFIFTIINTIEIDFGLILK